MHMARLLIYMQGWLATYHHHNYVETQVRSTFGSGLINSDFSRWLVITANSPDDGQLSET
jgi:hypothetical protein